MSNSSLRKPAKLQPGSPTDPVRFGHYYLLGLIARGGMAEVYRARLIEPAKDMPTRLLAIKVMRPELAREARFVDMFIREGRLAVLLACDAIVRTFEVGEVVEAPEGAAVVPGADGGDGGERDLDRHG